MSLTDSHTGEGLYRRRRRRMQEETRPCVATAFELRRKNHRILLNLYNVWENNAQPNQFTVEIGELLQLNKTRPGRKYSTVI